MKASELRIGNLIIINGEIIEVGYGVIMDMYRKEKNRKIRKEYLDTLTFEPIPITEEWLLKFGFEKEVVTFFKNGVIIHRFRLSKKLGFVYNISAEMEIQYVHQLQNLYFSLTGEELTIKE